MRRAEEGGIKPPLRVRHMGCTELTPLENFCGILVFDRVTEKQITDDARDGTSIQILDYTGCAAGTEVRGYMIEGGGHAWPGGMQYLPAAIIGKTSHNLDASETIWEFFAAHSR